MYGEAMRNSTGQVLANTAKQDGLFLPSCLQHSVNAKHHDPPGVDEKIDSQKWELILADWFFGRGKLSKYLPPPPTLERQGRPPLKMCGTTVEAASAPLQEQP